MVPNGVRVKSPDNLTPFIGKRIVLITERFYRQSITYDDITDTCEVTHTPVFERTEGVLERVESSCGGSRGVAWFEPLFIGERWVGTPNHWFAAYQITKVQEGDNNGA